MKYIVDIELPDGTIQQIVCEDETVIGTYINGGKVVGCRRLLKKYCEE